MREFSPQIPHILDHIIASLAFLKPELALISAFVLCILGSLFLDRFWKFTSFSIAILGVLFSIYFLIQQLHIPSSSLHSAFFDLLLVDDFSIYARILTALTVLLFLVFIKQYLGEPKTSKKNADLYAVVLCSTLGLYLLSASSNWLMLFIAMETVSISSYILVGFFSENKQQAEASMKYVLFGSIVAAVMLYGLSLLYGFTGNLNFDTQTHINGLIQAPPVLMSIALLFILMGIGFKLSFVPFHLWTPDIYQGAPTAVTAFLATAPKIGTTVLFARLISSWTASPFYYSDFLIYSSITFAILTMLVGNLAALRQSDSKRLLAYSSIGHTGFLLMLALVYKDTDYSVILYYLSIYIILNSAAFMFVWLIEKQSGRTDIASYAGLGKKFPILFSAFTLLLIGLIGLPPTAGFMAKLLVFSQVFEQFQNKGDTAYLLLLIVGVLTTAISLFFYFRIPLYAFLKEPHATLSLDGLKINKIIFVLAIILTFASLFYGIFPESLLTYFR